MEQSFDRHTIGRAIASFFVMAGGLQAVLQSIEGAEDSETNGADAVAHAGVNPNDVVIAVAASGTTPFTIRSPPGRSSRQAVSIAVANNRGAPLFEPARHRILIETGNRGPRRFNANAGRNCAKRSSSTCFLRRSWSNSAAFTGG